MNLERAFVSRKDAKTPSFSMRYLYRRAHPPSDGIIACDLLFFFTFLATLREQLPTLATCRTSSAESPFPAHVRAVCCKEDTYFGEKRCILTPFPDCERKTPMRLGFHAQHTGIHWFWTHHEREIAEQHTDREPADAHLKPATVPLDDPDE